jgi:hypothetical protein
MQSRVYLLYHQLLALPRKENQEEEEEKEGKKLTGKTFVIVFTVNRDVLKMTSTKLLDSILDSCHSLSGCSGLFCREVGVTSCSVPITLEGLGVE